MTTFFQLADALSMQGSERMMRRIDEATGGGSRRTPESAMLLNPTFARPRGIERRPQPEAANDNRPTVPRTLLG